MQVKFFVSVILITICGYHSNAQSLAVNTDGSTANASALLDVKSISKGVLIPRMTRTERNSIASPATGLLIFQNGPDSIGFHYYDGTKWTWLLSNSNADSLAWRTNGNTGSNPATHFLGTTDNVPLVLKTNNSEKLRVTTNGELGMGTSTPNSTYGYAKVEIASEGYLAPTDLLIRNAVDNAGYAPGLVFQHARGTLATPTTVNNGDYLSAISTMNYDGTNYILSAGLDIYADGAIATGMVPTRLQFGTMNMAGAYAYRMTIKNNGRVGFGTTNPLARTHIAGGNFLADGVFGTDSTLAFSGAGTRMFFYPRKAALRAGNVSGTQWDDGNMGNFSVGLGQNAQAKTDHSVSIGEGNIAETSPFAMAIGRENHSTGFASLAMGHFSEATGDYSVSAGLRDTVAGFGASSMGSYNKVSSAYGFAAGFSNTVAGTSSMAVGNNNFAPSFGETTIGNFATQYTALSAGGVNFADRIFTIGNGTGTGSRSDAMVVLKNGKTGIGTATPSAKLHIGGGTRFTVLDTGSIFLQSGNTIGSARDWKIAVTLPNGYLSFRDMGFDNTGTGAMATDAMVMAWGTGNVGIATPTPAARLDVAADFKLGALGSVNNALIKTIQNIDVGSVPANGELDVTVAVANANTINSAVFVSPVADIEPGIVIAWARVSAANSVKIRFRNTTGSAIDPAAINYVISVLQ